MSYPGKAFVFPFPERGTPAGRELISASRPQSASLLRQYACHPSIQVNGQPWSHYQFNRFAPANPVLLRDEALRARLLYEQVFGRQEVAHECSTASGA